MKFLTTQLGYILEQPESRRNLKLLGKLVLMLGLMITLWAFLFHVIMWGVEDQEYSWFTGFYWTLTVMTTLGFGDITFHTDLGRAFSTVVLVSGVVYLLIVMPFAFIRFFYAPWLDAQLKSATRRQLPESTRGHVIIARHDAVARGLIEHLAPLGIPYVVIEADAQRAAELHGEGVSVVVGDFDSSETLALLRAPAARMLVANLTDASNTNLVLTCREVAPRVPIVALAESWDSVDILELSGANHVLPLKHHLGQQLALRAAIGSREAQVIGRFRDLLLAELAVHHTPLEGLTLRETGIRQDTGLNVVGVWQRSRFEHARPDLRLEHDSVMVVMGTQEQIDRLLAKMPATSTPPGLTLVIGGGKVGRAAARALMARGVPVHILEKDPSLVERLQNLGATVFTGDAADKEALMGAGLAGAHAVLLSTNDDAVNIYLAVYCRRLVSEIHIVSRITHERNLEAIHRAGADFVLSYGGLAVRALAAHVFGRELVLLGEGVDVFFEPVPPSLVGLTLASSEIGARTGLNVIAVQRGEGDVVPATAGVAMTRDSDLIMIGTSDQRRVFTECFGAATRALRPNTAVHAPPELPPFETGEEPPRPS